MFKGVITALVTPIKNNHIDETSLRNLVEWQIENGIQGLVPCGTTGESATLSTEEKKEVIHIVIDQARKRVPVITGTGTNNTQESVKLSTWAKEAGADAILAVTPYYNKPSQEGLFRHYSELAKIGLPIILYNVPGRTSLSLSIDTIDRLSKVKNIVAIKEATGSLDFGSQILKSGNDIALISGDDFTFLPLLSIGAQGVISVVSNVIPKEFSELYQHFTEGNLKEAQRIHFKFYPLIQALFIETNPVPVKTALSLMKKISLEFRLPLCEMSPQNSEHLKLTLKNLELI
ncbi:MAG: 4-hydroxy-tetrahydrodipicolinate synthase [Deltaproteobacteria bacterium GWA2_38_16]|nr:MAG: 4-hydroxy-tetrahydrodipicolinate synthase [Deltaproteobacteria bacterium GWA2_38_16]OGQ33975.1 MAG: 4-hydroxy-tetrahydrodipicolinate synthase [Deltaproteobacteria bacterium RIFCSPLOWO2_01_FULL_38_9]HBQ22036.1 4-hydroxy-tetrahydrodipicolinate synthase [Deltaproteobacteria bacterium]